MLIKIKFFGIRLQEILGSQVERFNCLATEQILLTVTLTKLILLRLFKIYDWNSLPEDIRTISYSAVTFRSAEDIYIWLLAIHLMTTLRFITFLFIFPWYLNPTKNLEIDYY